MHSGDLKTPADFDAWRAVTGIIRDEKSDLSTKCANVVKRLKAMGWEYTGEVRAANSDRHA